MTQYDRIEYNPADGVEGFYYKLDKMASCMVEHPSNYSFLAGVFLWIAHFYSPILWVLLQTPTLCLPTHPVFPSFIQGLIGERALKWWRIRQPTFTPLLCQGGGGIARLL
jgi:hypothetical protein